MATAAIFDMDGLIVDSEPLWREAEIATFADLGLHFTEEMCKQTMGWRTNEVIAYWYEKYRWTGASLEEVENNLLDAVDRLLREKGEPLPGVVDTIQLAAAADMKIGLASSSPMRLINTVLQQFQIANHFEVVHSAQFETHGKPHPQVFITAAAKLGVLPQHCVVFEDSFYGLIAAKAARMKAVAVPDDESRNDPRFCIADLQLNSLTEFKAEHFSQLLG